MSKKSWRETFGTIGVKVQSLSKMLRIWPMVARQKDQTLVLVAHWSKAPIGRTTVKKTDS